MGDTDAGEELASTLETVLRDVLGPVSVVDLRRLSGGASRATWSFRAVPEGAPRDAEASVVGHRLILQRSRGGVGGMAGPSMADEDLLLEAAASHGVPVPPTVVPVARAGALGDARVTRHVDGETLGRRIVRDDRFAAARAALVAESAAALAALHRIDPSEVRGLAVVEPLDRLRGGLDLLGEARPAFELALAWLESHRPAPTETRVVHGDFRLGNLIVDPDGLRAVLDWELAHLGDPVEDLGWLCVRSWRFGGSGEVAGVGSTEELLAAYAAAGGDTVTPEHLRWWILAGTLTWGLICAVQARRHLDGHVRSVELATIGRRIAETEYDLLQLLEVPPVDSEARVDPEPPALLEERPTAAELVEAVRSHLDDEVAPGLDGSAAFHVRVASNALAIVERQLRDGPAADRAAAARFERLGVPSEADLAHALRHGTVRAGDDVLAAVRAAVVDRLRVANPRWLLPPDDAAQENDQSSPSR